MEGGARGSLGKVRSPKPAGRLSVSLNSTATYQSRRLRRLMRGRFGMLSQAAEGPAGPAAQMRLPELLKQDLSTFPSGARKPSTRRLTYWAVCSPGRTGRLFRRVPGWSNPFHVGFEISRTEREPMTFQHRGSFNDCSPLRSLPRATAGGRKGEAASGCR